MITMNAQGSGNAVTCRRCRKQIRIEQTDKLAEEFTLACPHCGFRGFYGTKDVRPVERT